MTPRDLSHFSTFSLSHFLPSFVSIDLETTGLSPQENEIIELGAVRFENGRETARFSKLVRPKVRRLPPEITDITGIRDSDLKGAPRLAEVAGEFIRFVGDSPLVGQNIGFDLGFLANSPHTAAHFVRARTVGVSHDAGLTARFIHPCLDSYGLSALASIFNTRTRPRHRGADDAAATGELFVKLLNSLEQVPLTQLALAQRILETTSSPLLNTLRAMRKALDANPPLPPPSIEGGEMSNPPLPPPSIEGGEKSNPPYPLPAFAGDRLFNRRGGVGAPDPFWASPAGRDNIYQSSGDARPTEAVPGELLRRLFADRARFEKVLPAYENRPQQVEMAAVVGKTFKVGGLLAVEAGTGVGKSLAYLAPALLSGSRVAISTHTKNLQDQLFYDEIPRLGSLFKFGFTAVLLKGRRNYLCRTRWRDLALDPERIPPADREKAALLVRWVEATKSGDISEVTAIRDGDGDGFFHYVASEPGFCTARVCVGSDCPLARIRKAAAKADLVVVNHSLVLSDYSAEGALLGDLKKVVFDEAHHLEGVATDHFGTDISQPALRGALDRAGALLRSRGELLTRMATLPDSGQLLVLAGEIQSAVGSAAAAVEPFFRAMRTLFADVPTDANYSTALRYIAGEPLHGALAAAGGELSDHLAVVSKGLARLIERLATHEEVDLTAGNIQEARNIAGEVAEVAGGLALSLSADQPNRVYWVEIPAWANLPVRLKSAPLDVSELLAEGVFKHLEATILTSATLTTGAGSTGFDHLTGRLGLNRLEEGKLQTAAFGSPFDYQRNCLVCCPSYLPHPSESPADHSLAVAETCAMLSRRLKRGMLVLLTSYESLRRTERELKRLLADDETEIIVQTGRADRDRLVRRFRGSRGGILLGTDALWEGIDVPGAALEIVVIAKLPFDVPGDPVVAARIEKLRDEGRSPFFEYQLPTAILRTRQGAGRLIRTATDRGVVLLLDPRVVTKGYGRQVRRALPGESIVPASPEELERAVVGFFESGK